MERGPRRTESQGAGRWREFPPGSVVTALAPSPKGPDLVVVRVGRSGVGTIAASDAAALGIAPGAPWDERLAEAVERAKARLKGRRYAMNALARRGMSRKRMLGKLAQRGVDPAGAAAIADDLERLGFLNDEAYAEALVRNELMRKPAGKPLLLAKLRQRGVEPTVARTVVDRVVTADSYDALEEARRLAQRRLRTIPARADPDAVRRRIYALLARRGFDPDVCQRVTREVSKACSNPED